MAHRLRQQHCGVQSQQAEFGRPRHLKPCNRHRAMPCGALGALQDDRPVQRVQQRQHSPVCDQQTRPCAGEEGLAIVSAEAILTCCTRAVMTCTVRDIVALNLPTILTNRHRFCFEEACERHGYALRSASADGEVMWKVALSQGRLLQ